MKANKTLIASLMAGAIMLTGCKGTETKPTKDPLQVVTETVEMSTDYDSDDYVGVVEAESSSMVSFTGTGLIVDMLVKEGQRVRKGQLIARLDTEQAQHMLSQARYGREQAANASAQARQSEEQARLAQQQAANSVAMAKAQLDQAKDAQERMRQLYEANSLPEMKWVEVKSKVEQAQASYDIALKSQEQAAVTLRQSQTGYDQTQTAQGQAGVTEKMAEKNLKDCSVYAPCDGVVTNRYLNRGEVALPSQPIVKIITSRDVKVCISVPEADIAKLQDGDRMTVRCAALEGEEWVSQTIVKDMQGDVTTHTYKVNIQVRDAGDKLLPGMVCNVKHAKGESEARITVPIKAVQQRADHTLFVWVAEGGKAHRRTITIAQTVGNRAIVTSGLKPGDRSEARRAGKERTPLWSP